METMKPIEIYDGVRAKAQHLDPQGNHAHASLLAYAERHLRHGKDDFVPEARWMINAALLARLARDAGKSAGLVAVCDQVLDDLEHTTHFRVPMRAWGHLYAACLALARVSEAIALRFLEDDPDYF